MRFFCIADLHGFPPPGIPLGPSAAAWLVAGDVCEHHGHILFRRWALQQGRVFLVLGNHDALLKRHPGGRDVSGEVVRLSDHLLLAGVGWCNPDGDCMPPREEDLLPVCESARNKVAGLRRPDDRVLLLTHYPPRGLLSVDERQQGALYTCVRDLVEELLPDVVVYGHLHVRHPEVTRATMRGREIVLVNPSPTGGELQIETSGAAVFAPFPPRNDVDALLSGDYD